MLPFSPRQRFTTRPPAAAPPPTGMVDIVFDETLGVFVAEDADGNRTGVSGVATDADGNLEVNAVVVARSGDVALTEDALGLNSDGGIIVHDGGQDGDDLPSVRPSYRIQSGLTVTQVEARAGYLKKIGGFPLSAANAVIGSRWRVSGNYSETHAGTTDAKPVTFGFIPVSAAASGIGVGPTTAVGNNLLRVALPAFSFEMEITDAGGGGFFILSPIQAPSGIILYNATDATAALLTSGNVTSDGAEIGTIGVADEIGLYVSAAAGTNALVLNFLVDVLIEQIA